MVIYKPRPAFDTKVLDIIKFYWEAITMSKVSCQFRCWIDMMQSTQKRYKASISCLNSCDVKTSSVFCNKYMRWTCIQATPSVQFHGQYWWKLVEEKNVLLVIYRSQVHINGAKLLQSLFFTFSNSINPKLNNNYSHSLLQQLAAVMISK